MPTSLVIQKHRPQVASASHQGGEKYPAVAPTVRGWGRCVMVRDGEICGGGFGAL